MGISAEIACCDAPDAAWLSEDSIKTHALGPTTGAYAYTAKLVPWLRENRHRFDAVIVDGIWQYHSLAVRKALSGSNVPYFVFTHGMLGPWFKKKYPLKHLKKWLYWPWADYRVLRDAHAVLFTCDEERLLARQSFWLYRSNEVVVGLGTSCPPQNASGLKKLFFSIHPELAEKRIVLFLGRLHKIKGCDLLIEAFANIAEQDADIHLVLAGPDSENWGIELQSLAKRLGISNRITWTGMLHGDKKWAALHAAEVFCLPSHHENFGVVVAEALACGKPVLISNQVNIWREILSASAGFVDDDTIEGTKRNLLKWFAMSSSEHMATSRNAKQCFEDNFKIEIAAKKIIETITPPLRTSRKVQ